MKTTRSIHYLYTIAASRVASLLDPTLLQRWRSQAKIVGGLLVVLSFYYLFTTFINHFDQVEIVINFHTIVIFIVLVFLGFLSYLLLAFGWFLQIRASYPEIGLGKSIAFIGLSQIAKYLPGNIGHILGRGALARRYMSLRDISLSFIIESLVMTFVYLIVGLWYLNYLDLNQYFDIKVLLLVFIIGSAATIYAFLYLKKNRKIFLLNFRIFPILIFLFILLSLSGGLTIYLLSSLYTDIPDIPFLQYTSGFALSFIIGFIMPGAPAGIGIREAVFILLFSPWLGEQIALEMILAIRLLTIIIDTLYFCISYMLKKQLYAEPV